MNLKTNKAHKTKKTAARNCPTTLAASRPRCSPSLPPHSCTTIIPSDAPKKSRPKSNRSPPIPVEWPSIGYVLCGGPCGSGGPPRCSIFMTMSLEISVRQPWSMSARCTRMHLPVAGVLPMASGHCREKVYERSSQMYGCNTLQHIGLQDIKSRYDCNTLHHTVTHCNTLQHIGLQEIKSDVHHRPSFPHAHTQYTLANTHTCTSIQGTHASRRLGHRQPTHSSAPRPII